ncbi:MAG: hypothetical protein ACYCXZ_06585 [Coriobacteriia bacterium]
MADRVKEIRAAVTACEIDLDHIGLLRAYKRVAGAPERVGEIGVLGVAEEILDAAITIIGPDAVTAALGDDLRISELMVLARALATRLAPAMDALQKKLVDLTETITED